MRWRKGALTGATVLAIIGRNSSTPVSIPIDWRASAAHTARVAVLLKGLEAELTATLNADDLDAKSLYDTMPRGSKALKMCSTPPILTRP